MDLLIVLRHEKKLYERKIGVEFKETDTKKVISQAITRKKYVDYMYVATRNVPVTYKEIFLMSYFGIGWIIWEEDFAKMIFPARYTTTEYIFEELINTAIRLKLREKEEKIRELARLDDFVRK